MKQFTILHFKHISNDITRLAALLQAMSQEDHDIATSVIPSSTVFGSSQINSYLPAESWLCPWSSWVFEDLVVQFGREYPVRPHVLGGTRRIWCHGGGRNTLI